MSSSSEMASLQFASIQVIQLFGRREEVRLEDFDDLGNPTNASSHGTCNLDAIASTSGFVDEHLGFRSSLHAHFVFRFRVRGERRYINSRNLCAIFKRSPALIYGHGNGSTIVQGVNEISCPKLLADNQQHTVFIDDVEVVNCPKEIGSRSASNIRSMVGLQLLDECKSIRGDQMFERLLSSLKIRLTYTDREVSNLAARDITPVQHGQLANDVI